MITENFAHRLYSGKTWLEEFKRLCYNIPVVQTETLTDHMNQVLHVSFSHNGKYFATCSKDGYVLVSTPRLFGFQVPKRFLL